MFDALRNVYLYLAEDPRGRAHDMKDMGFNIGLASFYLITPGIAHFESTA